jgi:transcription antitermination factor NusG
MTDIRFAETQARVPPLAAEIPNSHWHAAYICAQHEKRVAEALKQREIEHFLPLCTAMHQWKDRRVQVEVPLFAGYVFVHLTPSQWIRVLQIPGVVRLVGFNGQPAALPDEDLQVLKNTLLVRGLAEPYPYLPVGRRVRIKRGSLEGLQGLVVRKKNRLRFVLSVHLISRSIAVEIDSADLEPAS